MKLNIPENIEQITPYPPGKPLDELEREYGITDSIKLASNENAWGPSPKAIEAIQTSLGDLHRYPDGSGYYLTQAIAERFDVQPEEVVLGNGSNEIIEFLVKSFVREGDEVITSHPSFLMYQKFVQVRGGVNKVIPLNDMHHDLDAIVDSVTDKTRLIFLDNPNNPTGTFITPKGLESFFQRIPESVIVVLDQAYVDFMEEEIQGDIKVLIDDIQGRCPVVLLRTFSKAYGISGLRVGFGLMSASIAGCLHKVRQPFNINSLALVGAQAALADDVYFDKVISETRSGMQSLMEAVGKLGCTSYPSQTNFFLIDVKGNANDLYTAMLYKGVIVRSMNAYGFPTCIRITVGTREENERFVRALADCLKELKYV